MIRILLTGAALALAGCVAAPNPESTRAYWGGSITYEDLPRMVNGPVAGYDGPEYRGVTAERIYATHAYCETVGACAPLAW